MGIFGNFFGENTKQHKTGEKLPWIPLEQVEQLEELIETSTARTQLIFKHSTTCGISRMILRMFSDSFPQPKEALDFYFLDLHAHRDISNEVASRFQVIHQSPQLLIIRDGAVAFHASHGAIADVDISLYL